MICVVCQLPDRTPERGQVCEPDRARIGRNLRDIARLYPLIDLQPGRSAGGSRPAGKPGSRLPLAVDPLDLTMPARNGSVSPALVDAVVVIEHEIEHRFIEWVDGQPVYASTNVPSRRRVVLRGADGEPLKVDGHDQTGQISVPAILDSWVRDWCEVRGENLPVPTVPVLVDWLSKRLDWACDEHPAVDEFAGEIKHLHATLRAVCGETEPKPERIWVPCPRCDLLALRRTPGDAYPIRCVSESCEYAGTEDEFQQYVGLCAAAVKRGEFPPQEPMDMVVIWQNTGEQVSVA